MVFEKVDSYWQIIREVSMNRPRKHSDLKLAMGLLAPSMLLLAVLVLIPMLSIFRSVFSICR